MNLFERKNCQVVTYALAALSKFGTQALDWDPLILRDAFQAAFSCKLSQRGFDKLQAGLTMIGTNLFQVSIQAFLACASACANKSISQNELSFVTLEDCCWAVFCWKDMLGYDPKEDKETFSPDIIAYIQSLMDMKGITKLPQFMEFANIDDQRLTHIQETLITDADAFQAYTGRQFNNVQQLKAQIKDKQGALVQQLKQMKLLLAKMG